VWSLAGTYAQTYLYLSELPPGHGKRKENATAKKGAVCQYEVFLETLNKQSLNRIVEEGLNVADFCATDIAVLFAFSPPGLCRYYSAFSKAERQAPATTHLAEASIRADYCF
jgi:hypothetical protein